MSRILLSCCCIIKLALLINATGLYTVIAPVTIRSNFKYNVAVSIHKADGPSKIKLVISGRSPYRFSLNGDIPISDNGPIYTETKDVEILPMSTQNVEFDLPKLERGDYTLTAVGVEGVVFRKYIGLRYANNNPSVYIQTDKATYKPADLVQFRVLFLDENTRPANIETPITISIQDGAGNRIKQWTHVQLVSGVYSGELQLSEQPVLGNWKIDVGVEGEVIESKSFEVDKYVLPKFEVTIDTAKDIAVQDGVIQATVRAKYTYGKPVKGKATVSIKPKSGGELLRQEKTIDVDGMGHVEFPIGGIGYNKDDTTSVEILAAVSAELTGYTQNSTTSVNVHPQRYKLEAVDIPERYKPGKTYFYQVVVKKLDGSPVRDATKKVKLVFEYARKYKFMEFQSTLNEQGVASFEVTFPEYADRYLDVKAEYDESSLQLGHLFLSQSARETSEHLIIVLDNQTPKLGKSASFEVKSSAAIPYFVYTIVARGNIVESAYVEVPEGRKNHTVKFSPSFAMIPKATIYVHYVFDNELLFAEKTVNFEKDFDNSIEISAPVQAKPGEEVKLQVKTDADSFVGLMGVDQSVLLLKSDNDLNRDDIFNGLNEYQTSLPYDGLFERYPGQISGLVTLTNANYSGKRVFDRFPDKSEYMLVPPIVSMRPRFPPTPAPIEVRTSTRPVITKAAPQIRKEFPETWIFANSSNVDAEGWLNVTEKIPDTITSWVITGFSLNPKTGIALTENPSKIRVFQPFFISTNLPYSVKRGEVIAIPVIIFNYMDKTLEAEVVMDNSDKEYEFTEATNEIEEKPIDEVRRVKRLTIPSNSTQSISFMIRPKNVGTTTLKITATSPLAGDTVHQKLKVEPEGVTKFENRAVFVNLPEQSESKDSLQVDIPTTAVPDSEFIEFSVMGDLLGPTLKNLDNLVRMPHGCGEQNMVNFVPNILVLKYLEATNRTMPRVESKAKTFLQIGYQRELTYKHDDGSYSAFGKSDPAGSTWLTAYVIRSFHQAKNYTDIDPKIVTAGLDFLASKQKADGEFPEVGKPFNFAHQNKTGLTSFVLMAFLENENWIPRYQQIIDKSVQYVAQEVDNTNDQYSLANAAVALQKAKHPKSEEVLAKLDSLAKQENGRKWWSKATAPPSSERLGYWHPRSNDVEITSYVLLALLERDSAESALPVIKWLTAQRNSNGGFASTQDTVIGLQALTKFASKFNSRAGVMDIEFVTTDGSKETIKVNRENALVLQTHVLPKSTRKVDFTAKGKGSAMVQLSYRYNLAEKDKKPSFKVTPTVKDTPKQQLIVEVCAEYVPLEESDKTKDSNMAVMEIALPSGYVVEKESFGKIESVDRVKRIETKNSDSTVIVYFDSLTPGEVKCLPVEATKAHAVAKQKPAAVSLYDYYDTERRATEFYEVKSSLCDICEGADCGSGCQKK